MSRHIQQLRRVLAAAAVVGLLSFAPAFAQNAAKPDKKPATSAKAPKKTPAATEKSAPARDKPAVAAKPAGGLDADQIAALLDVLQLYNPAMAERLVTLRDTNQEQFHKTATKLHSSFSKQIRLKRTDPEAFANELEQYQLQKQVDQLTDKLKKQPDQRKAITAELRTALDTRELSRIRGREHELTQFEKKLIPLRQALADQQARQDKLTDQRLNLLLSDKIEIGPAVRLANKPEKQGMVVTAKPGVNPPPVHPPPLAAPPAPPAPAPAPPADKANDGKDAKPAPPKPQTAEDKQIDQVIDVIHAARPALADRLTELRGEDPKAFAEVIKQLGGRFRSLIQKKKSDPEGFAMQVEEYRFNLEAMELAASMRQMPTGEADTLKPQLRHLIEQQFQAHQQLMQHELDQMEKRFEALRSDIEHDRRTKDESVDRRLTRLLADADK